MRVPCFTKQFSKDVKLARRRGKKMAKLKLIAGSLVADERLDSIHQDHKLIGDYAGRRECHIESDWLLIYKLQGNTIAFERSGTHSDLFRK